MTIAFVDFETRSTVDLARCGVENYAEHPLTQASCLCWAFDDGPVFEADFLQTDAATDICHDFTGLYSHVAKGGLVVAHNARFELHIWRMMAKRYGWPELRLEQIHCTMAMGRALALPGSLDKLSRALRLPFEKDRDGHRLMLKLCKPRKPRKGEPEDAILWNEDPADLARQIEYCKQDVIVERAIYNTLPKLTASEQEVWILDQRINDRGIFIDIPSVDYLELTVEREKKRLTSEIRQVSGGGIKSAAALKDFHAWTSANGLKLPDLRKGTIKKTLARTDLLPAVRRVVEIRKEASKSSTAKLKAMRRGVCADSRARGLFEYHGAATGRWAGRRIQPQNMTKPAGKWEDDFEIADAEGVFAWARVEGGEVGMSAEYGSAMDAISWSLRPLLKAEPGNTLMAADYSNIEGRMLAWLAGEQWKISAFEDFDAGTGADLYKLAYSKSFGVPVEDVTKPQRSIGKIEELALGYGGAHGAFISMAANKDVDLADVAATVRDAVSAAQWTRALDQYYDGAVETAEEMLAALRIEFDFMDEDALGDFEEAQEHADVLTLAAEIAKRNRHELSADQWAAVRIVVDSWRGSHQNVKQFWGDLRDAAVAAVANPGEIFTAGRHIAYRKDGEILYCRLPNGRKLAYNYARLANVKDQWGRPQTVVIFEGTDGKTKRWGKQRLWGGLQSENCCQAAARDILCDAAKQLERAVFPIVLHVHDELVSEMPSAEAHRFDEFQSLMADVPTWARGLPVAVSGWHGERYRK